MSSGMAFLGGFLLGGITAFIVLAVPMRQRYMELTQRWELERARRIEAEGHDSQHTNDGALRAISRDAWGHPLSTLGLAETKPSRPQSVDDAPAPSFFIDDLDDELEVGDG